MNTKCQPRLLLGFLWLFVREVQAAPEPHHFESIVVEPDAAVRLVLGGSVSNLLNLTGATAGKFLQLFDMYPVDVSTNLVGWTRLVSPLRTINSAEPLMVTDVGAHDSARRFYRTETNYLLTAFPRPSGPFPVGTMDRVLIDPARTNRYRYTPATNAIMATIWYPAEAPTAGARQAPMWDRMLATDAAGTVAIGMDSQWTKVLPTLVGQSVIDAPLASSPAQFPVILYSHGLIGSRKTQSHVAEELASHGYVILALDHPDCWGTEFPDGRYLLGNHAGDVAGRLKDMQFLLDEVGRMAGSDPVLRGRLDVDRIAAYGISYGGMTVESCRSDARLRCVGLWDPTNVQIHSAGLQKPFLVALGESNFFFAEDQWLFSKAVSDAVWLQVRDAEHLTATDFAWTSLTPGGRRPALAIDACMVWFFDTYLKGGTPDFPQVPEIYNLKRK